MQRQMRADVSVVAVSDATLWDAAVAANGGHVLQAYGWGELKAGFGWEVLRLAVRTVTAGADLPYKAGAQVLFRRFGPFSLAYIPRGPWGDLADGWLMGLLWQAVHREACRRRAIFLKIEPPLLDEPANARLLAAHGFHPSTLRVQPVSTIVVDLTADLDALSARLKPKWRYNIGLAKRKGVVVRQGGLADLPTFYRLLQITAQRDGFAIHVAEYYRRFLLCLGEKARLFLAFYKEEPLAGIMVTAFAGQAVYMYGASGNEYRNLMPNHLLQWEAMLWAKATGCRQYDLWGIPDTSLAHEVAIGGEDARTKQGSDLAGVYRFKAGFGGQPVRLVGAWDYTYNPLLYRLWNLVLPRYRRL